MFEKLRNMISISPESDRIGDRLNGVAEGEMETEPRTDRRRNQHEEFSAERPSWFPLVQVSRWFNLHELRCPCCNRVAMNRDTFKLLEILDKLCDHFGGKGQITSLYRCRHRNEDIDGRVKSSHMWGRAADYKQFDHNGNIVEQETVAEKAREFGAVFIWYYPGRTHIDVYQRPYKGGVEVPITETEDSGDGED